MTTQDNQIPKNQIERAHEALQALKPDITSLDRTEAERELNYSRPTIDRYLTGKVRNVEVALNLIRFFRRRIEARNRELAA